MVAVAHQATSLSSLLARPDCSQPQLAAYLDGLDAAGRLAECRALTGKEQKRLWEAVAGAPAFTVDDLVSPSTPEGKEVIWGGKNSLLAFRIFEKRFMRQGGKVIGYNKQSTSWLTGPGYFTCVPSPHEPREIRVDYTQVPTTTPAGWPEVKPNDRGFSNLVYKNLYDYLRRVSQTVCIGFATRLDKPMDSYFVLARE
jgi:hypothetical protein